MNPSDLVEFLRKQPWAVEATVTTAGRPQAAVIGVVVSDACELFFDTLETSRKCANLRANPHVAFVLGLYVATVQLEGVADEPRGAELSG